MHFKILLVCAFAATASAIPWNYQGYNYVDLDDTHVVHSKPVIDFNTATFETQSHHGYWSHPGLYSTAQQYLKPGYGSPYTPTIFLVAIPHTQDEGKVSPQITVSVPSMSMLPPTKEWNPSQLPVYHHSIEIVPLEKSDNQATVLDVKLQSAELADAGAAIQEDEPVDATFGNVDPEDGVKATVFQDAAAPLEEMKTSQETSMVQQTKTSAEVGLPDILSSPNMKTSQEKFTLDNLPMDGKTSEEAMITETKTSAQEPMMTGTKTSSEEAMVTAVKTSAEEAMSTAVKTSAEEPKITPVKTSAEEASVPMKSSGEEAPEATSIIGNPSIPVAEKSEEAATFMPEQVEESEMSMKPVIQVPVADKIQSDETLSDNKEFSEADDFSSAFPTGDEE